MLLRDYLHHKRIKLKDFASMCGCCRQHIHKINCYQTTPGPKLVRKIEEVTNGQVTRYDLLKDCEERIEKI